MNFEIVAIPYVQASWFVRHPGLPCRCALKSSQDSRDFYTRANHASSPMHASGMLAVSKQATDGGRTFTFPDSQPCRPLPTSRFIRLVPPLKGCRLAARQWVPPVTRWLNLTEGDLPPLLHGNYPASSLLRSSSPLIGASVLSASWGIHLCLFPSHHRPGSQVPHESPDKSHAAYTPAPRMASK